jgi:dethiobiotin synthetase
MPNTHEKMPKGVFVTGTDTGVGKTFVSIQLIHALKGKGIEVVPRKPVESGCQMVGSKLRPADALAMQRAVGSSIPLREICPYRLQHALSPERAAVLEGMSLSLQLLETACRPPSGSFLLVEGAGGFYSPLAADGLVADLAHRLNLAVVLVSTDRLGCINQILLNVQAIESRGLGLAAIILNQLSPPVDPEMDNLQDLRSRLDYPMFRIEPRSDASNLTISPAIVRLTELLLNQENYGR